MADDSDFIELLPRRKFTDERVFFRMPRAEPFDTVALFVVTCVAVIVVVSTLRARVLHASNHSLDMCPGFLIANEPDASAASEYLMRTCEL